MTKLKNKSQTLRNSRRKVKKQVKRDYKKEYARRKEQGLAKGFSLSKIRGHRSPFDAAFEPNRINPIPTKDFATAMAEFEKTGSFRKAAWKIHVTPELFRNEAFDKKLIHHDGKHWQVVSGYPKKVMMFSDGHALFIEVPDFRTASRIGQYMNAVRQFLNPPQNFRPLRKFVGKSVKDTKGRSYVFETDKNILYRIARTHSEPIDFYDHS